MKLNVILLGLAALGAVTPGAHAAQERETSQDAGWRFERLDGVLPNPLTAAGLGAGPREGAAAFDDSAWERVMLPHTARMEDPAQAQHYFQGVCWYRRTIAPDPAWRGKKVSLRFEGAMQVAEVWVNGRLAVTHEGGYLPFTVDLTDALAAPGGAVVAVRLDNRDKPLVPPGKRHDQLDFAYFGGLYRDVKLVVTDPLHITDAVAANRVAGGGIFVRTEASSAESATVFAQADVLNEGGGVADASVRFTVLSPDGRAVAQAEAALPTLAAGDEAATNCLLTVTEPKLWHPDHPWLYTLKTEVRRDGKTANTTVDTVTTRFGIRTLAYDDKLGFVINGEPLTLRGANRHQDHPWIGNAVPDNEQFRDLKRLKEAGFNFLRLAHYPQSPAVMAAADELGLMVSVCTPGWQYFGKSEQFTNLAERNIREMVRWHRNHPSAIMWEVSLNETYGHDQFYAECARLAHEEYPGGQMFTSGDTYASKDGRRFDVPYSVWEGGFGDNTNAPGFAGKRRSFTREYGDYSFGGEHSTSRVARGEGENRLLLEAWNNIWNHNHNLAADWVIGDCLWVGIDHFRGCSEENPLSRCGVLDYLRLPKFSYYYYQSQRTANAPEIYLANYWTPRESPAKVVVFSNCEEVELRVNGKTVARRKPDAGPDSDYGVWHPQADPVYMASGKNVQDDEAATAQNLKQLKGEDFLAMFDGGNGRHTDHPPFTFAPVTYAPGELEAVGYLGGKPVVTDARHTPGKPAQLRLEADTEGRPPAAQDVDAVFLHATVCDAEGNPVPDATNAVAFAVSGPAQCAGAASTAAEAGVATVLLRTEDAAAGKISVTATAAGLRPAQLKLKAK